MPASLPTLIVTEFAPMVLNPPLPTEITGLEELELMTLAKLTEPLPLKARLARLRLPPIP